MSRVKNWQKLTVIIRVISNKLVEINDCGPEAEEFLIYTTVYRQGELKRFFFCKFDVKSQ